jgi:hypothetical protein
MTTDERLEFLRQSTESLHASCQELHAAAQAQAAETRARLDRQDARERKLRAALMAGMAEFLRELSDEGEENQ